MPDQSTLTLLLVVAALAVLVALTWFATRLRARQLPYYAKERLCSKGELAFYRALNAALPTGMAVSMKTRLSDVIGCTAEGWKKGWGAKISQKHVDFVVYDPVTTAILLVIELDDRTHDLPERQARDVFVDQALQAAGVAIVRVIAAKDYDVDALEEQLSQALRYVVRT